MVSRRRFEDLVAIMDRLRGPGGCPWDREQTYSTLRGYLLEECYEVLDALDRGDRADLREELGDLLFQIVFLSRLAHEEGAFEASDVVEGIAAKMVRRHPHVFGEDTAEDSAAVLKRWEEIKRDEKKSSGRNEAEASVLDGIPRALPELAKAQRLGAKAARVGFDWREDVDVLANISEEVAELREAADAGEPSRVREEMGDVLFTIAMLARRLGMDAEEALALANAKFRARFEAVERELRREGTPIQDAGLEKLDRLWNDAKSRPEER